MSKQFSLLDADNEAGASTCPIVHTLPALPSATAAVSIAATEAANCARITEYPNLLSKIQCDELLQQLMGNMPWEQCSIRIAGKQIPVPRLQCWMGDRQSQYSYSGMRLSPLPWRREINEIRQLIQQRTGHAFNSVLLNYYRGEKDSVAWHADDEVELGPSPVIASLSLGAERVFELKPKMLARAQSPQSSHPRHSSPDHQPQPSNAKHRFKLSLQHGQLIVMSAGVQERWLHQVPKSREKCGPRVNLTFRWIQ